MATIQRILVPVDFSETSNFALDYAIDLAKKLGATVTVMHAFELPIYGFPDGALVASAEVASRIVNGSTQALAATLADRTTCGVTLESALRQGPADEEIVNLAKLSKADLIVMGTHGRRGLARALLGSVAEKVVRTALCPVLTLHGSPMKVEGFEVATNPAS